MIDILLLETQSDIYIPQINEFIHQPTIQEIAHIAQGEKKFFELLNNICKTLINTETIQSSTGLTEEEKKQFSNLKSFDYFIDLSSKNIYIFISFKLLLKIFFPNYICNLIEKDNCKSTVVIEMSPKDENLNKKFNIDKNNYDEIISYIQEICCISRQETNEETQEFKPANEQARKIAEKIQASRKIIQKVKNKTNDSSFYLAKIINLLRGTGAYQNSELNNMTIYQLTQAHKRHQLYEAQKEQINYHANGFEIKEFIDWAKDLD